MKTVRISARGVGAALTVLMTIGMLSIQYQQEVWSPRSCAGCVAFKKLTHELEKNVINAVIDPNSVPPSPVVRELLDAYNEKIVALFFTDPWLDQVRTLLQSHTGDVTKIFDTQPPDPDKQLVQD